MSKIYSQENEVLFKEKDKKGRMDPWLQKARGQSTTGLSTGQILSITRSESILSRQNKYCSENFLQAFSHRKTK